MKKFTASIIAVVTLVTLLGSCVSLQDRPITMQERAEFGAVGTATIQFHVFKFFHFIGNTGIKNRAYDQLLAEARKQYGMDVDVRNIQIKGGFSALELLYIPVLPATGVFMDLMFGNFEEGERISVYQEPIPPVGPLWTSIYTGINLLGHFEKITATADVIRRGAGVTSAPALAPAPQVPIGPNYQGLEAALDRAAGTLINEMQRDARIAILSVSSNDRDMAAYAMDELEYKLVQSRRFQIVDRRQLEQIRAEQNFQLSGDVSDDSAVSIGQMLGASIVITGDISSFGTAMRLSLRAIDVRTARILTIARESF